MPPLFAALVCLGLGFVSNSLQESSFFLQINALLLNEGMKGLELQLQVHSINCYRQTNMKSVLISVTEE